MRDDSPDFIVSNEILFRKGEFTSQDIVNSVTEKLLDKYFENTEQIEQFVKNKLSLLCEVGVVSYTGLIYYT